MPIRSAAFLTIIILMSGVALAAQTSITSVTADNPVLSDKDIIIEARNMNAASSFRIMGDWMKSSNSFVARTTNTIDTESEAISLGFNSPATGSKSLNNIIITIKFANGQEMKAYLPTVTVPAGKFVRFYVDNFGSTYYIHPDKFGPGTPYSVTQILSSPTLLSSQLAREAPVNIGTPVPPPAPAMASWKATASVPVTIPPAPTQQTKTITDTLNNQLFEPASGDGIEITISGDAVVMKLDSTYQYRVMASRGLETAKRFAQMSFLQTSCSGSTCTIGYSPTYTVSQPYSSYDGSVTTGSGWIKYVPKNFIAGEKIIIWTTGASTTVTVKYNEMKPASSRTITADSTGSGDASFSIQLTKQPTEAFGAAPTVTIDNKYFELYNVRQTLSGNTYSITGNARQKCVLESASIEPECGSDNVCKQGENVTGTFRYTGNCPLSTAYFYVPASSSSCQVTNSGTNGMKGMSFQCTPELQQGQQESAASHCDISGTWGWRVNAQLSPTGKIFTSNVSTITQCNQQTRLDGVGQAACPEGSSTYTGNKCVCNKNEGCNSLFFTDYIGVNGAYSVVKTQTRFGLGFSFLFNKGSYYYSTKGSCEPAWDAVQFQGCYKTGHPDDPADESCFFMCQSAPLVPAYSCTAKWQVPSIPPVCSWQQVAAGTAQLTSQPYPNGAIQGFTSAAGTGSVQFDDSVPPSVKVTIYRKPDLTIPEKTETATNTKNVELMLEYSDIGSGIDSCSISFDNRNYIPITCDPSKAVLSMDASFPDETEGVKRVYFNATDRRGNSAVTFDNIYMDKTPPIVTVEHRSDIEGGQKVVGTLQRVRIAAIAGDNNYVSRMIIHFDSQKQECNNDALYKVRGDCSLVLDGVGPGIHYYSVDAIDAAGNTASEPK